MLHVTLADTETREIILAETYDDHDEFTDLDPETNMRTKIRVTAEEAAEARTRGLVLEASSRNALEGLHLAVYVSTEAFAFPPLDPPAKGVTP